MMQFSERMNLAITTAQSGEREKALHIFEDIVAEAPANVQAWLWISELTRSLEDQTRALEQAMRYASEGKEIQQDLQVQLAELRRMMGRSAPGGQYNTLFPREKTDSTKNDLLVMDKCQQADRLAILGRHQEAIQILQDLEKQNLANERVWLTWSELESNLSEKTRLLNKVLEANPNHEEARERLDHLRMMMGNPLQVGQHLEENGSFDQAIDLYKAVVTHSRSAADRIEANRRISNIEMLQHANQAKAVHPNLNLLRLTAGPVLLFMILVFIQSGLNLLNLPLLALPGLLSTVAGSLIISATEMRPMHPQWIAWFGAPGTGNEPKRRREAKILGWGLIIIPYALVLISAGVRFGIFQASMDRLP